MSLSGGLRAGAGEDLRSIGSTVRRSRQRQPCARYRQELGVLVTTTRRMNHICESPPVRLSSRLARPSWRGRKQRAVAVCSLGRFIIEGYALRFKALVSHLGEETPRL